MSSNYFDMLTLGAEIMKSRVDSGIMPLSHKFHRQGAIRYMRGAEEAREHVKRPYTGSTPQGVTYEALHGIFWGRVWEEPDSGAPKKDTYANMARGTVAVFVNNVGIIPNVRIATSAQSRTFIEGQGYVDEKYTTGIKQMPQKDDLVILVFIDGMKDNGLIIAYYPSEAYDNLFVDKNNKAEPMKRIDVHPSFWWEKLNQKGDHEIKYPDGTFITVKEDAGTAAWPATPPDVDADLTEKRNPVGAVAAKTFTISHPSGTWVRIKADGTVEMVVKENLNVKVNGDILYDVDGNVTFDIAQNCTFNVGGDIEMNAVNWKANASAKFEVASPQITLGSGTVTINGTTLDINSVTQNIGGTTTNLNATTVNHTMVHTHPETGTTTLAPTGTVL